MVEPFDPRRRLLYADYTVLCTAPDGSIGQDPEGLYDHDTRILSGCRFTIDGRAPTFISSVELGPDRRLIILLAEAGGGSAEGPVLPQDAVELRIETHVGPGARHRLTLVNRSAVAVAPTLELELEADFADVMAVGRRSRIDDAAAPRPSTEGPFEVVRDAQRDGRRFQRGVRVVTEGPDQPARPSASSLAWQRSLPPRGEWSVELTIESLVDGRWRGPVAREDDRKAWLARRPTVETEPPLFGQLVERAMDDLHALRNRELAGDSDDSWVPNAGVPTYTGLFGRDSLTTGWQSLLLGPEVARGALRLLAATQAEADDPFRDEEPGKLLHERRRGPLSELDLIPQRAYYGSQTTPAMFPLALSEVWHWTGDTELLRRHRETATRALAWAADHGDLDGDGFLESRTRSPHGLRNQGWKDSNEAIRYPDGSNVEPPLSTVEEDAFHLLALERMAEVLVALEADEEAGRCLATADALRARWHDAFWMPDAGFYAMALDADKHQVGSIGSNAGHALGAGVVPREHAAQVADRLLRDDLFSGWGVRTLSSEHPSYNPYAYHLGTVWPVEQATFALGMKRYGLDEQAARIVDGMIAAAAEFRDLRLPEALAGLDRAESPRPVPYPYANSPQAWTASATIQLLQITLGLYPFAPLDLLALVRPRLPTGVDRLTIRRLRIGNATVSLRFERDGDDSATHAVLEQDGRLLVIEAPPPQDVHGGSLTEALKAWALDHAPGRPARALRIALGHERSTTGGRHP